MQIDTEFETEMVEIKTLFFTDNLLTSNLLINVFNNKLIPNFEEESIIKFFKINDLIRKYFILKFNNYNEIENFIGKFLEIIKNQTIFNEYIDNNDKYEIFKLYCLSIFLLSTELLNNESYDTKFQFINKIYNNFKIFIEKNLNFNLLEKFYLIEISSFILRTYNNLPPQYFVQSLEQISYLSNYYKINKGQVKDFKEKPLYR